MTPLHEAVLISGVYVAGCLTGHRVVTAVVAYAKAFEARVHTKLDKLIAKTVNTIHPLRK